MTVAWRSPLDLEPGSADEPERRPFRFSLKIGLLGIGAVVLLIATSMMAAPKSGPPAKSLYKTDSLSSPSAITTSAGNLYAGGERAVGVPVQAHGSTNETVNAADHSRRAYALPLARISGLPSSTQPGTRLDLWALWEPPVTTKMKAQLLIRDIVLEGIVPPVTQAGPETAILLVPTNRISDLIYADRFSQISAALIR